MLICETCIWHLYDYRERNRKYAEVCKSRAGNEKYMDRSVQTLNGALKHKQVQSDSINMADSGQIYN